MNNTVFYLVDFTIISVLFFGVFLLIKRHSTPTFRRFFLLAWMLFSVAFPFVSIDGFNYSIPTVISANTTLVPSESIIPPNENLILETPINEELEGQTKTFKPDLNEISARSNSTTQIIQLAYSFIAGLFLLRILLGISQIWRMKNGSEESSIADAQVYLVNKPGFKGASFFNWIFIGISIPKDQKDIVLQHELIHRRRVHSIDILMSHIYQTVFWFHPLSWVLKKQISLNTELEADHVLTEDRSAVEYGNLLLSLGTNQHPSILNHFSARHLKARIKGISNKTIQKKWVILVSAFLTLGSFFVVSCTDLESNDSAIIVEEKLNDVKTITTRFTSHQDDTQQKTGKIVSIVSFNLDGSLDEFITKTTYPYDFEYEVKRGFWDTPIKKNLFYVMDGLGLGKAERVFLYGSDWSNAYLKYLKNQRYSEVNGKGWGYLKRKVLVDDEIRPKEIRIESDTRINENEKGNIYKSFMPGIIESFEYENEKVVNVLTAKIYDFRTLKDIQSSVAPDEIKTRWRKELSESGKKKLSISYEYEGDLVTSAKSFNETFSNRENKFFYENGILIKHELILDGKLVSTRMHYYKNGLKDRTEIFNIYNEPEYTIHYEYEFW